MKLLSLVETTLLDGVCYNFKVALSDESSKGLPVKARHLCPHPAALLSFPLLLIAMALA